MPWALRGMIIVQLAVAALVGASCRHAVSIPGLDDLPDRAHIVIECLLIVVGPGAALPVLILAWDARVAGWKKWAVTWVELAMGFAYFRRGPPGGTVRHAGSYVGFIGRGRTSMGFNRADLQQLADDRALDSKALLDVGRWAGAYYLAGYAIECALKARIAKQTNLHDFPDKNVAQKSYTHDLSELLELAGLRLQLKLDTTPAPTPLGINWERIKSWNERARYEQKTEAEARRLYQAVTDNTNGVLSWIKGYW